MTELDGMVSDESSGTDVLGKCDAGGQGTAARHGEVETDGV